MKISHAVACACGAALIAGCQTTPISNSKPNTSASLSVEADPTNACADLTSKYPSAHKEMFGNLATLATPAISAVAKSLGDALVSASGKNDMPFVTMGRLNGYLYTYSSAEELDFNNSIKCIDVTSATPNVFDFRFGLVKSKDNTAFEIIPVALNYGSPLGDDRKVVSMNAVIEMKTPDGKTVASATLPLNAIPGQPYTSETVNRAMSAWMTLPAMSSDAKSAITSIQSLQTKGNAPPETLGALRALLQDNTPVTVEVTITETRSYSAFLAAVGQFLSDNSTEVGKDLGGQASSSDKPAANAASKPKK